VKRFKRRKRGGITAEFTHGEAELLCNLAAQIIELLRDRNGEIESDADPLAQFVGLSGAVLPPEDPVLMRLLPNAYRDNDVDAAEFRRYTEQALTDAKVENGKAIIQALYDSGYDDDPEQRGKIEVELDDENALAWLKALTDIRLALAIRLGIETEDDMIRLEQDASPEDRQGLDLYEWLGFVQETLVEAVSR
jgi:hypothetical protein